MWCKAKGAFALGVALLLSGPAHALETGAAFPLATLQQLEGEPPARLEGSILVVDFWASWCAPCKASFPSLSALHTEFKDRGVVVLGVSVDEKKGAYEQFLKRTKPSFPTLRDSSHLLAGAVKVPTMPSSFIVDRTGKVRFVHAGFHADTTERLRKEITLLLEESP